MKNTKELKLIIEKYHECCKKKKCRVLNTTDEELTKNHLIRPIIELVKGVKIIDYLPRYYGRGKRADKGDYGLENNLGMILLEAKPTSSLKGLESDVQKLQLYWESRASMVWKSGIATNGYIWVFVSRENIERYTIFENGKINEDDWHMVAKYLSGRQKVPEDHKKEEITKVFYKKYEEQLVKLVEGIEDCNPTEVEQKEVAQTIINRLIFIKFLESHGIIKEDVLEYIQENKRYTFSALKKLFFQVMNTPKYKREELEDVFNEIPYLNGSLFEKTETEIKYGDYRIRNSVVIDIITFLQGYNFVSYEASEEGILDPEILGYIFEKAMNENERKGTGAYYTPKDITRYISEHTIYPYIVEKVNERLKKCGIQSLKDLYDKCEYFTPDEKIDIMNMILGLKILDPACGSGAFLWAVSETLFCICNDLYNILGIRKNKIKLKKDILKCIYGVDINPRAIEITKLRMWLWVAKEFTPDNIEPLPNIDFQFRTGNSLIGRIEYQPINNLMDAKEKMEEFAKLKSEQISGGSRYIDSRERIKDIRKEVKPILDNDFYIKAFHKKRRSTRGIFDTLNVFHWGFEFYEVFKDGGFDIVVGNPPYGNILSNEEKKYVQNIGTQYIHKTTVTNREGKGSLNGASVFLERSHELLKNGGILGYIVPHSVSRTESFQKCRRLLVSNYLYHIVDEGKAFDDVTLEMISLFFKKIDNVDYDINIFSRRDNRHRNVNVGIFLMYDFFVIYYDEIFEFISKKSRFNIVLGEYGIDARGLNNDLMHEKNEEYCISFLGSGSCVNRYRLREKEFYWCKNNAKCSKRCLDIKDSEVIITTSISNYLRCTIKPIGMIAGTNVSVLNLSEDLNKKFILAVINSKLIRYVFSRYVVNLSELTLYIHKYYTRNVPIVFTENISLFVRLVDHMLRNYDNCVNKVIDFLVYELYFETDTNLMDIVNKVDLSEMDEDDNIKREIQKIKAHPWVQRIENEMSR